MMTVIVYRDGVLAADSGGFVGDILVSLSENKVRRHGDYLAACAGKISKIEAFHNWLRIATPIWGSPLTVNEICGLQSDVTDDPEQFGAIVVEPNGNAIRFDHTGRGYPAQYPWLVEGCHAEFLQALLIAGYDAEAAVAVAIKHCAWATGAVQSERIGP